MNENGSQVIISEKKSTAYSRLKFTLRKLNSYGSIYPVYHYTEQFSNNVESHESTKWLGILLAFISGILFTISSAIVKGVRNVDPMILLSIRAIVQIIAMLIVACKDSKNLIGPKDYRLLVQFQGFVGGMTLSMLFYSFRKLPLGDATTIIFSSPMIVIVLSFFFLKEPCGVLRITVICALFAGIVLVAQPPFLFQMDRKVPYDVVGYICALSATLFTALNIVVMRKCLNVHYSIIVFNLSVWSLVYAVVFFVFLPMNHPIGNLRERLILPKDWFTWEMITMISTTGLIGQVLVAKALKIEGAGKVSVTRSLDILLAYFIQYYFFEDIPSTTSVIGAMLILFSVICMGFEKEIYGVCDFIP